MAIQLAIFVAAVLTLVLVVFLIVITYNNVVALQRRCQRAWANIDVALKQRHDQLPNLVAAVRGAMRFEEQVLEAVTRARANYQPDAPVHDQAVVSEETSKAVRSLFAVVENY
ncbi:MAG: LemA family protein, partial [Chloroflexota bacterium]|nr:LemA family protein [Chloroflexota bacterium]